MAITVQTNVPSLQAQKNINKAQGMLAQSFNRLSSGFRINSSADDAAGLAISESMKMQIRSYTVAERNANDAISMAQTADGALGEMTDIFGRMRELAMQGASGSLQQSDRDYLQTEFSQLQAELTRIMASTKFNGIHLIATAMAPVTFQVGINNVPSDRITVTFGNVTLATLLASSTVVSGTAGSSQSALDYIDSALSTISTARARFGAVMNRLQITTSNLQTSRLNVSAANSAIRDVDIAEETSKLARTQVLQQAAAAVLSQANQLPQTALALLKG